MKQLLNPRVLRFGLVGVGNTLFSFLLLNIVYYFGHTNKIAASLIATACAMVLSFALNRSFVFADKTKRAHQQAPSFVVVTILGSFVVLNLVYILSLHLLDAREQPLIDFVHDVTRLRLSRSFVDINVSTVVGAAVAMVWNYNGYKWFVFKGSRIDGFAKE